MALLYKIQMAGAKRAELSEVWKLGYRIVQPRPETLYLTRAEALVWRPSLISQVQLHVDALLWLFDSETRFLLGFQLG